MAQIIIGNDERDLLLLCKATLEDAGHEVEVAASGADMIALARERRPDLLIVDWIMPDMDGATMVIRLRSFPETRNIPVLGISALRDGATRAELVGTDGFLAKPFDADALVEAAERVLRSTSQRRAS